MWNCTHFRHPTDEQLRQVDIYFLATNIICSLSTLNCEAKDFLLPTTKLAILNLSVSSPGSVFLSCSRNDTKYEKILDAADFASRENCSFIRLNDAFRKILLEAAKKTVRQHTMRAEFSLIGAMISK